jgi:hypothetical protein
VIEMSNGLRAGQYSLLSEGQKTVKPDITITVLFHLDHQSQIPVPEWFRFDSMCFTSECVLRMWREMMTFDPSPNKSRINCVFDESRMNCYLTTKCRLSDAMEIEIVETSEKAEPLINRT